MKLTKRTLSKLIKEELSAFEKDELSRAKQFTDASATEDPGLEVSMGELSPEDRKILKELIERFTAIAKAKDKSGEDVELKDYRTQISAKLLELERLITGERGERIGPGRVSQQADVVQTRRRAKELARKGG
tara:strand:- start:937 stop:1332 length:396 start_codon:yes stop_codon:yes gene_type:complete